MEGAVLAAFGQSETRTGLMPAVLSFHVFYKGNYDHTNRDRRHDSAALPVPEGGLLNHEVTECSGI